MEDAAAIRVNTAANIDSERLNSTERGAWDILAEVRDKGGLIGTVVFQVVCGGSWIRIISAIVGEDGFDVAVVVISGRASRHNCGPEPIVVDILISSDNHIVSLPDSKEDPFSLVWDNRDKIRGQNGEFVPVERDFEVVVYGCVDEAETVGFALFNGGLGVLATSYTASLWGNHETVNQAVVGDRGRSTLVGAVKSVLEDSGVIPISDGESSEIFIVIGSCRTVDNNRTNNTISVLGRIMGVFVAVSGAILYRF